jgi:hypothetical protein
MPTDRAGDNVAQLGWQAALISLTVLCSFLKTLDVM